MTDQVKLSSGSNDLAFLKEMQQRLLKHQVDPNSDQVGYVLEMLGHWIDEIDSAPDLPLSHVDGIPVNSLKLALMKYDWSSADEPGEVWLGSEMNQATSSPARCVWRLNSADLLIGYNEV